MSEEKKDPYAALRLPEFRLFILSRFSITLAIQIQTAVVLWQVFKITNDAFMQGLVGLAEAVPSIVVSLYAGHLADILRRKKIIITTVFVLLLCSAALLVFALEPATFLDKYSVYPIYAVIFVSGIARGFLTPALFSFMPQLVPRDLYKNAITWNSTFWEIASIGGPPISGLIVAFWGLHGAYTLDVVLMIMGLSLAVFIADKPLPPATSVMDTQSTGEKIKDGLRFVFRDKLILSAISLDLFAVLFGGAVALLPNFAEHILKVGETGYGFLRAAPGVGAFLMSLYIAHNPITKHTGKILLGCVAGFGLCILVFGLSRSFWLSMTVLMLSGVFDCVSVIIRGTLLQTRTPEHMKGRVSAVNNIFIGSSNEIGAFESGTAARLIGLVPAVLFGGVMTLATVSITAWKSKSLRQLQRLD